MPKVRGFAFIHIQVDEADLRKAQSLTHGVGWIDAGIVASCLVADRPVLLYTRDRRMREIAVSLGVEVIDAAH